MPRDRRGLAAIALICWTIAGAAGAADAPKPLAPPPPAGALKDGLTANIYFSRFEHIADLERVIDSAKGPAERKTFPQLDFAWAGGNVLETTSSDLVGADIRGLIRFDRPGTWRLKVTSNDGIRLTLGGVTLFEDPEIHGDSDSPPLPVAVAAPAYYPLEILYYEKKGMASLKLMWAPPDADAFVPVPPEALKHLP